VVNGSYNRSEATSQVRDAYGRGMATGVRPAIPDMHSDSGALVHPIDRTFNTTILANYNAYVKSGDLTGAQATSFSSLAPYEANTRDYTILKSLATYTLNQQPGPADRERSFGHVPVLPPRPCGRLDGRPPVDVSGRVHGL